MSINAVRWALRNAPVSAPSHLAVLVVLAEYAHDDGTGAWPSRATIAEQARVTPRTVSAVLRQLEAAGAIRRGDQSLVAKLRSDHRPVVWDLELASRLAQGQRRTAAPRGGGKPASARDGVKPASQVMPASTRHGVKPASERGEAGFLGEVKPASTNPPLNHPLPTGEPPTLAHEAPTKLTSAAPATPAESEQQLVLVKEQVPSTDLVVPATTSKTASAAQEFDTWWAAYPRKVGKGAARNAYLRARKTVEAPVLLDAVLDAAAGPWARTETRFIPHPATWLRQGRWDDEHDPGAHLSPTEAAMRRNLDRIAYLRAADHAPTVLALPAARDPWTGTR